MSDICMQEIKKIYNSIPEELSREIYANRLLYSFTSDRKYIQRVVAGTPEGIKLEEQMDLFNRFILFGGGIWGGNILWVYPNLNWICVWDNSPQKEWLKSNNKGFSEETMSLPIVKYTPEMEIDSDTGIVISSRLYHDEISHQLIANGISANQIIDAGGMIDQMSKRQYFDLPYLTKRNDEVFIDAGTFDGETTVQFHKTYNGKYQEIIAFEPDETNITKFKKRMDESNCHDVTLHKCGLWDRKEQLSFSSIGNGSSMIDENGEQVVCVDKMDDLISKDKKVSFIKMDLEGAEYKALQGAERIICAYHPKLAISLYHKPEDVWQLPSIVLTYDSSYKFYLRHYSIAASETVLYAI